MSRQGIFTPEHLKLIQKLYLRQHLPPREVTREVNEKFGTTFTPRQISCMLVERGLSKRRKLGLGKAILAANDQISLGVQNHPTLAIAKDIVAGHQRIGQKITAKAEQFVDSASSAKTLSSAASAAKVGISIIRQVLGLDSPGATLMQQNNCLRHYDPHGPDSPFSPEGRERQRIAAMKRAEAVKEPVPVEIACVSVNAESMDAPPSEPK